MGLDELCSYCGTHWRHPCQASAAASWPLRTPLGKRVSPCVGALMRLRLLCRPPVKHLPCHSLGPMVPSPRSFPPSGHYKTIKIRFLNFIVLNFPSKRKLWRNNELCAMYVNIFREQFTYVCKFVMYQKIRWTDGWFDGICDKASEVKCWWQNLGDKLRLCCKFLLPCLVYLTHFIINHHCMFHP